MLAKISIALSATLISLYLALQMITAFAPQLLGRPADLTLVRSSEEVIPFFENSLAPVIDNKFFLNDPVTIVRGNPWIPEFMGVGPHDLLGFRNRNVPNLVDVLTIGDSQTYGLNASLEKNWPSTLQKLLGEEVSVYSAALGGWGAMQYLEMFDKLHSRMIPRVAVVMFYSGNDSLESFKAAYGIDKYKRFRIDQSLSITDLPSIPFPPKERWGVNFNDGSKVILAPGHRLLSNNPESKVVQAGYEIMRQAAMEIAEMAAKSSVKIVFALMPTTELVYSDKISAEIETPNEQYLNYIKVEREQRGSFEKALISLAGSTYVDLLPDLKEAVDKSHRIYPEKFDGHPNAVGYHVVATALRKKIAPILDRQKIPDGIVRVIHNNRMALYSVANGKATIVKNDGETKVNLNKVQDISIKDLQRLIVQ